MALSRGEDNEYREVFRLDFGSAFLEHFMNAKCGSVGILIN
jgi:hypothetical protein